MKINDEELKDNIKYYQGKPYHLAPGARIDDEGRVVAPPFVKKEDILHFLYEHKVIISDDLKQFFDEKRIDYNKTEK